MKKLAFTLLIVFSVVVIIAQSPHAFKYQTVIRNASGEIIPNQLVSIRLTIMEGYPGGTNIYTEEHQPITGEFGLVSLELGQGTTSGDFSLINWSRGNHFLQVELDETGTSGYQLMGISPLLSVPYSKWADSAGNVNYSDTSAINEIQQLAIIDHELFITDGNSIILPDEVVDPDADPGNELQFLFMSNDTIFLTEGGFVKLPPDMVEDADPDPGNELQVLFMSNDTIFLSDGGFVKLPVDISDDGDWITSGNYLYVGTDSIGIGKDDPKGELDVQGSVLIGPSWSDFESAPFGGLAVYGSVGIGTSNPAGMVDIEYGGTNFIDVLRVSKLDYNDHGTGIVVQSNTAPSDDYNFLEAISDFSGTPITQFVLRGDGFFGIGPINPQSPLHIDQKLLYHGVRLEYDDFIYWDTYTDGAQDYNFSYYGTLKSYIDDADGSYNINSDKSLKTNINPIINVLDNVKQLQPSFYQFKYNNTSNKKSIGLIAQEVEPFFPEAVQEKDGIKAINYDAFAVIAIQAIKEQQQIIEELKLRIEKLENK